MSGAAQPALAERALAGEWTSTPLLEMANGTVATLELRGNQIRVRVTVPAPIARIRIETTIGSGVA